MQFIRCPVAGFEFIEALVLCTEMQRVVLEVLLYTELVGGVPSGLGGNQSLTLTCASYAADG